MVRVDKAVAAVVRRSGAGHDLLVFRHPLAGVQIPKGTVEPGEAITGAALRELEEESGLAIEVRPLPIGTWQRVLDGTFGEEPSGAVHTWHVCLIDAPPQLPESWRHVATGSPEEDGLVFEFHWLPLDAALEQHLHPVFAASVQLVRNYFHALGARPTRSAPPL